MKTSIIFLILACHFFTANGQVSNTPSTSNSKPSFGAELNGSRGGAVKKDFVWNADSITIFSPANIPAFSVAAFTMTIVIAGEPNVSYKNNTGGSITKEMKEAISKTPSGVKIYFEYIKARHVDGSKMSVGSISFMLE